jgi:serine phosphatase RsbU (regulator of sigma subunit)
VLGGDFYDVVVDPSGTVHAIIGAVSGYGANEAALGALLRVSWRALVLAGVDEPQLLPKLQQVLVSERPDHSLSTTVCTVAIHETRERANRTALVRLAGHPPPIVVTDAARSVAPEIGPPLGTLTDARWDAGTLPLGREWALLLYTPGLIGGRGTAADTLLGTEGLIDLLAHERGTHPDRVLERLLERAQQLNEGPLVDDVTTLLLGPDSTPADTASGHTAPPPTQRT